MGKIIACVDGSIWQNPVCDLAIQAQQRTDYPLILLHAAPPPRHTGQSRDLSGQIGLGAKKTLLAQLAEIDAEKGKLIREEGQKILRQAGNYLQQQGLVDNVEIVHRRGVLVDILKGMTQDEDSPDQVLVVMGKKGEGASYTREYIGSQLEEVTRSLRCPVLVASKHVQPIRRFVIAFDGRETAQKAVQTVCKTPWLQDCQAHIVMVGSAEEEQQNILYRAAENLQQAGFSTLPEILKDSQIDLAIADYIRQNKLDCLVIGAWAHHKLRNLLIGSTTTSLLHSTHVPALLIR